jgi:hypothetical protein
MRVLFESYQGKIVELQIEIPDTIAEVRWRIFEEFGIIADEQIMNYTYNGVKSDKIDPNYIYAYDCLEEGDHIFVDRAVLAFNPYIEGMG